MKFGADIKSDSLGQLRGAVQCVLSSDGLAVSKSGKPALLVPIGIPAQRQGSNQIVLSMGDRLLTLAVVKFTSYQNRMADGVAAYLRGERPAVPEGWEYRLEPYFTIASLLPFGTLFITRGGAIWGAICGVFALNCFVFAKDESRSRTARLLIVLVIAAVPYALVFWRFAHAAGHH